MYIRLEMLQALIGKVFVTSNDRELIKYNKTVNVINGLESKYQALSDDELKGAFSELKESVLKEEKTLEEVLEDSFAITRAISSLLAGVGL